MTTVVIGASANVSSSPPPNAGKIGKAPILGITKNSLVASHRLPSICSRLSPSPEPRIASWRTDAPA